MRVAIITGEASGDRVGGQLAAEIRRQQPDAEVFGTGGRFLRESGAEVIIDSSRWGVVGLSAAIGLLPKIMNARARLFKELLQRKPDVLVPVDAGAFNLGFGPIEGMCSWARRMLPETKILYYFPPGSWRRTLRATSLNTMADRVATPFPWSEVELRRLGADAVFVGHPLLDLVRPETPLPEFFETYGVDRERPIVGLLPGSRPQEIDQTLPLQLRAAEIIQRRVPGVQFVIALAPTVDREVIVGHLEQRHRMSAMMERNEHARRGVRQRLLDLERAEREIEVDNAGLLPVALPVGGRSVPSDELARRQRDWIVRASETPAAAHRPLSAVIVENATYDVMAASDVLMITSGTATLEAAILGKPMVIVYKMSKSPANLLEYKLVKNSLPPYIGLPNLLAESRICPEFVQDAATPEAVSSEVIGLLLEPERLLRMRADLQKVVGSLGEPGGAARTARMVIELAGSSRGNAAAARPV